MASNLGSLRRRLERREKGRSERRVEPARLSEGRKREDGIGQGSSASALKLKPRWFLPPHSAAVRTGSAVPRSESHTLAAVAVVVPAASAVLAASGQVAAAAAAAGQAHWHTAFAAVVLHIAAAGQGTVAVDIGSVAGQRSRLRAPHTSRSEVE